MLIALLAASAPQLRSLEHWDTGRLSSTPELAMSSGIGKLSQLTSLRLNLGSMTITTARVDSLLQTLPALQHLALLSSSHYNLLSDGFPLSL